MRYAATISGMYRNTERREKLFGRLFILVRCTFWTSCAFDGVCCKNRKIFHASARALVKVSIHGIYNLPGYATSISHT